MIYLDTSAVIALLTMDAFSDAAAARLSSNGLPLAVSDFTTAEVFAVLAIKARRGDLGADQRDAAAARYDRFRVAEARCFPLHAEDARVAGQFVRQFDLKLRAPDALQLAICQRIGTTLLSFDDDQCTAAAKLGIPLAR